MSLSGPNCSVVFWRHAVAFFSCWPLSSDISRLGCVSSSLCCSSKGHQHALLFLPCLLLLQEQLDRSLRGTCHSLQFLRLRAASRPPSPVALCLSLPCWTWVSLRQKVLPLPPSCHESDGLRTLNSARKQQINASTQQQVQELTACTTPDYS